MANNSNRLAGHEDYVQRLSGWLSDWIDQDQFDEHCREFALSDEPRSHAAFQTGAIMLPIHRGEQQCHLAVLQEMIRQDLAESDELNGLIRYRIKT